MAGENLGEVNSMNSGAAGGEMAAQGRQEAPAQGEQNSEEKPVAKSEDSNDTESMIAKLVAEKLAPMKANIEKAYSERDAVAQELAKLREQAKAAEIQRLQDDGKEVEALQLKHSELQGKYEALLEQNTSLTRDQLVANATAGLDFRNEAAKRMAMSEIIGELVKDGNGQWVHKSGVSVKDAVEVFSKDDDKSFLFKPKNSSGASTVSQGIGQTNVDNNAPYMTKPVGQLTTQEMMQAQKAGRFGDLKKQTIFGNL